MPEIQIVNVKEAGSISTDGDCGEALARPRTAHFPFLKTHVFPAA